MRDDYRVSHLGADKAKSYHEKFLKNPYRSMIWALEKDAIDRICKRYFPREIGSHLDFACGSGRLIGFLRDRVGSSIGVDVSTDMLEIAKREVGDAKLIHADLTDCDVLGQEKFQLITAFRFFPNAQEELRDRAMAVLVKHMNEDSLLIFNNHKNAASIIYAAASILPGRFRRRGVSRMEIEDLVCRHGLEVLDVCGIGRIPVTDRIRWIPRFVLEPLERLLMRLNVGVRIAVDQIIVCRRKAPAQG